MGDFITNYKKASEAYEKLIGRKNIISERYNGIYDCYEYPVLTAAHAPLIWRYDMNPETNPFFIHSMGTSGVMEAQFRLS